MKFISTLTTTTAALVLLAWLPGAGPFFAGLLGGWIAGSFLTGVAVLLTVTIGTAAVIAGGGSIFTGAPWFGAMLGTASLVLIVLHVGPLVVGMLVGVVVRKASLRRRRAS